MTILHSKEKDKGSFYIDKDGERVAEIFYREEPGRIVIEHTEVDEALQGQNVGFTLVEHTVEYAREHNQKVVPLCTFAAKVMKKHQEFSDVL